MKLTIRIKKAFKEIKFDKYTFKGSKSIPDVITKRKCIKNKYLEIDQKLYLWTIKFKLVPINTT